MWQMFYLRIHITCEQLREREDKKRNKQHFVVNSKVQAKRSWFSRCIFEHLPENMRAFTYAKQVIGVEYCATNFRLYQCRSVAGKYTCHNWHKHEFLSFIRNHYLMNYFGFVWFAMHQWNRPNGFIYINDTACLRVSHECAEQILRTKGKKTNKNCDNM